MKTAFQVLVSGVLLSIILYYFLDQSLRLQVDKLEEKHREDSISYSKLNKNFLEANGQLIELSESHIYREFLKAHEPDSIAFYTPSVNE
jgi:hypothetical protein